MSDPVSFGAAAVTVAELQEIVAASLGEPSDDVTVTGCRVDRVDYDVPAILTLDRHWVSGTARTPSGERPFRLFVKTIGSFTRSPLFELVPEDVRSVAAAVPWRTEADVYRSELAAHLPLGLRMPRAYAVRDIDDLSAALWLEAVPVVQRRWSVADHAEAAFRLGRFAASPGVAGAVSDVAVHYTPRQYASGRFEHQVVPALRDDALARHPLLAPSFGPLRPRMLAAVEQVPHWLDELEAAPIGTSHGDASVNNLLRVAGSDDLVLLDFGFLGRQPVGFDLAQLLVGEIQLGRRAASELAPLEAAIVPAFVAGLTAEGMSVPGEVVQRVHALQMSLFSGLSAYPFEHLASEPTPELMALAEERAQLARFCLDLVDSTRPIRPVHSPRR
ncbi:MAG TPA: phosphotransferase [Dermatophilaceae bacterium]|nr:phosphotransferase [Dermatophilaceae bacterium]